MKQKPPFSSPDEFGRARQELLELRQLVGELQLRNLALAEQLRETRETATITAGAISQMQVEREMLKKELGRLSDDLAVMESQHANMTSLYVAAHQLHGTMDRETAINRIEEIVINFIGSEEFGVYERTSDDNLRRIAHVGLRDDDDQTLRSFPDVADAVKRGEAYIAPTDQTRVAACIPLKIDEKLVGCIAIYRLLPHKVSFEPLDLELFDLLRTHAAAALVTTRESAEEQPQS